MAPVLMLGLLTLLMFFDVLFASNDIVLSARGMDVSHFFVYWRELGFQHLAHGELALWNPHFNSGTPFFGGFQSALLYPPNALFLILPLPQAINWSIALHVFLAGAFTCQWVKNRGLHPLACFAAGAMFMFSGPYFLHIYAGHLPNLCTMVWTPLIFLAIDQLFDCTGRPVGEPGLQENVMAGESCRPGTPTRRLAKTSHPILSACLLGITAVTMQILAGHVQYVYYTALAAGLYCVLRLIQSQNRTRTIGGLAVICIGAAALSAVQLFTGLQESRESLRGAGVSYEFASSFSFPPENLLTLLTPGLFGDIQSFSYWGRGFFTEVSLFTGITGLCLAIIGAIYGDRTKRPFALTLIIASILLAFGQHTPVFNLLYHAMPGFAAFRGTDKFIFITALFLALLAAVGLDHLIRAGKTSRFIMILPAATGLILLLITITLQCLNPTNFCLRIFAAITQPGEYYSIPATMYTNPQFALSAAAFAAKALGLAAATLLLLAALFFALKKHPKIIWLIPAALVLETFTFARNSLARFHLHETQPAPWQINLAQRAGDRRILNLENPNAAMTLPAQNILGDDPGVLRRYADFLAVGQHSDALLSLVRCGYVLTPQNGPESFREITNTLPRLQLIQNFTVINTAEKTFAALTNATFNSRDQVILETAPNPLPAPSADLGTVKLLDSGVNHLTIEAHLPAPAILLVTDAYARGWRIRPLTATGQTHYQIMPANHFLRAVPLAAGDHLFRMEYLPTGFIIGKWVSLISLALYLAALAWILRHRRATWLPHDRENEPPLPCPLLHPTEEREKIL